MQKIYDVHAHTNISPLLENCDEIFTQCVKNGILYNCIGTELSTSILAVEQSKKCDNVFAIIGIHPNDVNKNSFEKDLLEIEKLYLSNVDNVVAIGETGLDYHYAPCDKQLQKDSFIKHIKLSNKYNLPLMVHVRDADEDCFLILKQYAKTKIIIHCFTGNMDIMKKYSSIDCYFSISGIVTFKNNLQLQTVVKSIPMTKILSETDAPFLAPVPFRGKTNSPIYCRSD